MREHGYVRNPAEPVALPRVEYANQSENACKPTCQIAADIKTLALLCRMRSFAGAESAAEKRSRRAGA